MKREILNIILIFLIIISTIALVPKEFKNDTFFSIAIGQNILEKGIETEEQLVWHENLEFTNSRWLFDVIIAEIYNNFDFVGIYVFTIAISIIQTIMYYYIMNKVTNKKVMSFIATIITMYFISAGFVARAQLISFNLFLLEFYFIERLISTNKNRYFIGLIIIPLLIVNFHASVFPVYFILYLPYIAEYILFKFYKKENKKIIIENINIKKVVILLIVGIICGFCVPKALSPFSDMFKAMSGFSTDIIEELKPLELINHPYFIVLCLTILIIMLFTKTKIKITDIFYVLGFALMSFQTGRCIFFFYIIASICIYRVFSDCLNYYKISFDFISKETKYFIIVVVTIFFVINSIKLIAQNSYRNFVNTSEIPVDATNYILKNVNIENMKIFNGFNFGSYLEFKHIPAFIDSRSGIYTPEFNEGCTVLEDWYNASHSIVPYKEIFDKYHVTHVLLTNGEYINLYIVDDPEWKMLYQDDIFSFYERIEKNT